MNDKKRADKEIGTGNGPEPAPQDQLAETKHAITIAGQIIPYTAITGAIVLKEETEKEEGEHKGQSEGEKPKATLFFVAYVRDDVDDPSTRPITFSFNGGPGSSSVWLHLGVLGPRRVLLDDEGMPTSPPGRLVENEASLLDVTDLVFIDPVSTGYSRPVPGQKAREFHSFKKDIESVGDFIRLYTTRYRRWASPKFLIGESYGTTRAAGLSGYLQERHGMYLNGIMLVSSVLNFQTMLAGPGNDLPYILYLPSYAAAAWHHRRLAADLPDDLPALLAEVEAFAQGEYNLALMQGSALAAEERAQIVGKLARYTGLSPAYIERTDLRIDMPRFVKELLRDQQRTIGRLDSRYTGVDRTAVGERYEYDPSFTALIGPYTAAFNDYVRRELQFESDLTYEIITERVWPWRYEDYENKYLNVAETLRKAIATNPHLKVYVASGYYDLGTPYFATDYTINHLGLPAELRRNVTTGYYEAGHMMYVHRPSLLQMKAELAAFVQESGVTQ